MVSSLLLALREGVEAALVIGILLGALRKVRRPDLNSRVWWGVISAALVSLLVAVGLRLAGAELEGPSEPAFEGLTMLFAAGLLTWMIFWMRQESRQLKGKIENNVRAAVGPDLPGGGRALFGVAFLAVVREGVELAVFLVAAGFAANTIDSALWSAGRSGTGWAARLAAVPLDPPPAFRDLLPGDQRVSHSVCCRFGCSWGG